MDLMSLLFGNKQAQPSAPAPVPQQFPSAGAAAATVTYPDAQTWLSNYVKAQGDLSRANPRSFMNWITGNQTKAAEENARLQGPAEFLKMLTAGPTFNTVDEASRKAQLGGIQDRAQAGLVSGQDIDPNNIPAAGPAYNAAMRQQFPDLIPGGGAPPAPAAAPTPQDATPFAPSAQPPVAVAPLAPPQGTPTGSDMSALFQRLGNAMPQGMPTGTPPSVAPAAPQQAAAVPANSALQRQRAMFDMYGRLSQFRGDAAGAKDYFELARKGTPALSAVVNGNVVDGSNGASLNGSSAGAFEAANAGLKSGAMKDAEIHGSNAINDHSAENQRKTDAARIALETQSGIEKTNNEKSQDYVEGYSTVDGSPLRVSKHDLSTGAVSNMAPGTNPYVEKHSKELEAANKDAQEAAQGLIQAKQLAAAAQGLSTGAWGDDIQDIRRGLASLGVGSAAMNKAATKGDVVNEIGLELAALRARASSSGRTALGTLNAFRSVKPGLLSTNPAAQVQALLPAFQRQVDYAEFANKYYNEPGNWNKLDAPTAFRAASPDDKYINAAAPPEPMPVVKNALKPGKSYFLPNNQIGTWNGQGFEVQQ